MKNKIIYSLIGLVLIIFNYQNRITTIDKTTLDLIEEVNSYDTEKLWPEFKNKEYMKDIRYNSSKEFRYDHGKIIKKTPDQAVASLEALKAAKDSLVKVDSEKDKELKALIVELKKSLEEHRAKATAVRILLEEYPKTIKSVKPRLEQLLKESDALVKETQQFLDEVENVQG